MRIISIFSFHFLQVWGHVTLAFQEKLHAILECLSIVRAQNFFPPWLTALIDEMFMHTLSPVVSDLFASFGMFFFLDLASAQLLHFSVGPVTVHLICFAVAFTCFSCMCPSQVWSSWYEIHAPSSILTALASSVLG